MEGGGGDAKREKRGGNNRRKDLIVIYLGLKRINQGSSTPGNQASGTN